MSDDIAIKVSNLSKCYHIYDKPNDRLKQFIVPKLCKVIPPLRRLFASPSPHETSNPDMSFYKEFWALKDVSFEVAIGKKVNFVQDNHSRSAKNVLRGLHYQIKQPQGKLVRVVSGEVFDVVVDIRKSSPTFGRWVGEFLSAENKKQMWIPEGFAHGLVALAVRQSFSIKLLTTMHQSTSVVLNGTMPASQ